MLLFYGALNAQVLGLTIGETFNWQVGDTLLYETFAGYTVETNGVFNYPVSYSSPFGFTILSRNDYPDSLVYTIKELYSGTVKGISIAAADSDVLVYRGYPFYFLSTCAELDSFPLCGTVGVPCDITSGTDSNINNRTRVSNEIVGTSNMLWATYEAGIGYAFAEASWQNDQQATGLSACGFKLVYYHSGNTLWVDSNLYYYLSISGPVINRQPQFVIYPNPATDMLNLETSSPFKSDAAITIYNVQGQLLVSNKIAAGSNKAAIPVAMLARGIYMVNVSMGGYTIYRGRFVKQ